VGDVRRDETVAEREIVITRGIAGPRHLVFEAFTSVDHLSRWFGPNGFTTTTHAFEFRPGGVWDFTMHGPDGTDYANHIEWLDISAPKRIEFRHGSRKGDPEAFMSTVTIAEVGERSEVTLRSVFNTKDQRDEVIERYHAIDGGRQTLGRLAAHVAAMEETARGERGTA
jgi:uncharacterized protein YndB with AHSA1/START domain